MGLEIKATKDGFKIIIDNDEDFISAREKLIKKFDESIKFFSGAKFLSLEAESFTEADKEYFKRLLKEKYDIVFFNEENITKNEIADSISNITEKLSSFDKTINKIKKITTKKEIVKRENMMKKNTTVDELQTKFIFENMRSGTEVKYDGNVVVFGDINPGAKIIAKGNIIVMGSCRGTLHAGEGFEEGSFIAALRLKPLQMKINGLLALPPDNADFIENAIIKLVDKEIKIEQF